jgi:hypothetical protein
LAAFADIRYRAGNPTSVIEDSMCIPSRADPEVFLHADEDVTDLVISVIGADGAGVALYDAGTKIEDVATPGTGAYTAPSASNVRVSPDGQGGGDCTEMQFANAVYDSQQWVTIRVTSPVHMEFTRLVYLNFSSSADATAAAETAIDNKDLVSNPDLGLRTLPTADYATASGQSSLDGAIGDAETAITTDIGTAQADLDLLTGTDGATLATSQPNYAPAVAGDAMDLVANAVDATAVATGAVDADAVATDAAGEIADSVWTEAIADHSAASGSTAEALGAAGSAGDPWATSLPGSYTSGQAGKIIGDNLNATVSSRASQTSVDDLPVAARDAVMQYVLDNGITFEETACHMLAVLAGEAAFTAGSPDQAVFQDPTGTDTRVTVEYGTDAGDRASVTLNATNCGSN